MCLSCEQCTGNELVQLHKKTNADYSGGRISSDWNRAEDY